MSSSPHVIKLRELDPELIAPSTRKMFDPDQGGSKIVVIGKPGCFGVGTQVIMYDGSIKNVEEIKVGEQVMGWDSKPRNIIELCRNVDEMYRIVPNKGDPVIVNKNHILTLKYGVEIIDITLSEYLQKSTIFKKKWEWFRTGVEFPAKPVKFDPYIFGLWLGGEETLETVKFPRDRIPDDYKINSRDIRLRLLAGIINAEGEVPRSEKLTDDILFIARSLGLNVQVDGKLFTVSRTTLETGFKVEYIGEDQYYGFTLDGDHRFLLSDFSVVHNTGKTTLLTSLLYEKRHIFPVAMVMSGTEASNGHYSKIFPPTFVYNTLREDKIIDFKKRQHIAKKHLENPWAVLLLDDVTDNPAILRKPLFQDKYKNGRHWKYLDILSLQYCMDIRPNIRNNIDGTFILREPSVKVRKSLWENYAGIIPDFQMFCEFMDQVTDNYTALFIHNNTQTNDWRDCVFWYKARKVPDNFKFGCLDYWLFHKERYNEEYRPPIVPV